ncbi:hypothetical protein BD410DRAFT_807837 [Rickenella mellea]|uniref:Xylanolytic transcriptional activator regulatory domain-containing protein n=1 Tax=Rickenella mellea TaxID=50990 RepID=A0A4Y7PQJ3_9AGAM|nr:hypothetical protein BD410DRAFT_807837 [Rickenella mellea]
MSETDVVSRTPTPSLASSPTLPTHTSSMSPTTDVEVDFDDLVTDEPPPYSKREYLLAQIRQKDAIIESLLKQLHNPYLATPMSIAAYRMASSPSDTSGSRNVLQWLERLQRSIHAPPHANNPRAWNLESRGRAGPGGDDDSESVSSPADPTEREREREDVNVVGDAGELSGVGIKVEGEEGTVAETLCANDSGVDDTVPLGLIAKLSLKNASTRSRAGSHSEILDDDGPDDDKVGLANEAYFMPGPASDLDIRKTLIERHSPPEILVHGLVTPDDVEKLFDIFYTRCNPFLGLLDPVLHTPASTFARCPFLFTVVCAVSSRYYREKSDIYAIAMHFAKHAAATALIDGWKSVELCQAYILMSVYAVPARRWEEDRSWLYTGLAIRIATDLNLHQVSSTKPTTERAEREILNRTRVWMICFNLDRSTATQFGKPSTIKEDYIIRNSKDWYKKSKYNHMYDVHLCAYSSLLRIVAKFHEEIFSDLNSPSGLNENLDFRAVTLYHDEKLEEYFQEWTARFNADSDPDDKTCKFRCTLLPFLVNYSRLVMFSFGFQQAFRRGIPQGDNVFFDKCLASATQVVKCVIDSLGPSGYLKFAPDGHFVFASFASAFLLKLLRPDLSHLLSREQANQILSLIGKLIQVLGSSEVSIDDRHTPKLHARFLAGLLAKHQPEGSSTGRLHPQHPPEGQVPEPSSGDPSASAVYPGGVAPSQGSYSQQETSNQQGGSNAMTGSASMVATPIYEPEATYAAGTGPLPLTVDTQMYGGDGSGYDASEEVLATMQALRNPAWWDSMMMPGFSWPDAQPTPNTYATHMSSYANAFPQPMHFQTAEVGLI